MHPCKKCGAEIAKDSRFCRLCGEKQTATVYIDVDQKWQRLKIVAFFFGLEIILCALINFIDYFETLEWLIVFDVISAIVALVFFIYRWHENKTVLQWPSLNIFKLISYIVIAISASVIVSTITSWLNHSIFKDDVMYYALFENYVYGKWLMFLFIAVIPALFEELAYRGYLLNTMLLVVEPRQAMFVSAFMFAIIHMSFISMFWLLPFSFALAYVFVREKTMWYGVFIHFFFNLTACLLVLL